MNLSKFPRRGYVTTPTPIEFVPRFSKALGGNVNIYIKRDDLLPGAAGGNKTRKLDFIMADAIEKGADTIITCGAIQSNHCRLTLSWAAKEGLDCHFILEERVKGSYTPDASGNNFLYQLLGVTSLKVVPNGTNLIAEMEGLAETLKGQGKNPYTIPIGGSTTTGALGYVSCAGEIMQQLFLMGLKIDNMLVPSGSAGTHGGLLAGMIGNNVDIPLTGIAVSRKKEALEALVYKMAQETLDFMDVAIPVPTKAIIAIDDYIGPGYSLPTDGMREAVTLLAQTEAILLDPVYSGKAMAGLIDLVRKGHFPKGSNLLFLHTGGTPALYAYQDAFKG